MKRLAVGSAHTISSAGPREGGLEVLAAALLLLLLVAGLL